jgi:cytochrome c oxidase cbb3-type subunit 3
MRTFAAAILMSLLPAFLASGSIPAQEKQATAKAKQEIDLAAGKNLYQGHCALCHGLEGGGGRGPDLRRPKLNRAADDEALKSLIADGIPPEMPEGWYMSPEEIANVAAFVRTLGNVPQETLPGSATRGEQLFRRTGCGGCHTLAGEGTSLGPDLTDIGARRGATRLRETLRNPSKTLPEGFLVVEVVMPSGKAIRGMRLNEDSFTIQLKDLDGNFHSLRKNEIRELKKLRNESPMPSYDGALSLAELDDLVAFLAAQRGRP